MQDATCTYAIKVIAVQSAHIQAYRTQAPVKCSALSSRAKFDERVPEFARVEAEQQCEVSGCLSKDLASERLWTLEQTIKTEDSIIKGFIYLTDGCLTREKPLTQLKRGK